MSNKYPKIFFIFYLCIYFSGCANSRPLKPSFSIARALETKVYNSNLDTLLKTSVNILQDMNYTIDVLNSDIGLITASRTTEYEEAPLDNEKNNESKPNFLEVLTGIIVITIVLGFFIYIIETITDSDESEDNDKSHYHKHHRRPFHSDHDTSPLVYRYMVTINLNELENSITEIRVSATGETERGGEIISTGGIHEPEFFNKFFSQFDKNYYKK